MPRKSNAPIVYVLCLTSSLCLARVLLAQQAGADRQSPKTQSLPGQGVAANEQPGAGATEDNMQSLKKQLLEQQREIEQLRAVLKQEQGLLHRLATPPPKTSGVPPAHELAPAASLPEKSLQVLPAPAGGRRQNDPAIASAIPPADTTSSPTGSLADSGGQQNPAIPNAPAAPIPLKIGSAVLTPVGFVDATEFFRTTNLGSGIGTSFGSLPFSNTIQGRLTENRFTVQNSRIGLQFDDQFGMNKVRAYLETDFLGAQPTNAFVTSNSNSLRSRLYWVDLTRGKFEFLAGQSWSLLTPGRTGISPMPSDIFYSQDMDTNYQVGLTWARQLQFRFVYHASPAVTAALSLENAEQYVGTAVVLPANFSANQVDAGASTSTPNLFPDVIGKLAFDPHVAGKHMHFEFAGLLSAFKIYSSTLNSSSTAIGGGGSFNFNLELFKNFHLVESSLYSSGGGRYIFGLGPDFIVRPDGTPSLVQADSGIAGFEYQVIPQTMFYGYYGGAYYARNYGIVPGVAGSAPTYVGYGFPGSSSSANRAIQEGTFGIIQTFWKNPRYGALQLITQYSYLTRAPWYVAPNTPKNAHLSQAYADIRYILP